MDNKIELVFSNGTTRLAGNPYGKAEYQKQVKDKIDFERKNIIIFPDQIQKVASSFTQGFFAEVIKKVGYANFDSVIEIKAHSEMLQTAIKSDLFV